MPNVQKYCLVKLFDKFSEGDEFVAANHWPLHVTLASNFIVDWESSGLFNNLQETLSKLKPIKVTVGEDEFFGPERNVQVALLDLTPELMTLHKQIIKVLTEAGAVFDEPQYNNDGYRAHVTVQYSHRLNKNDVVLIDEVTIIDMFPNQDATRRKVLKTIKISGD